MHSGLIRACQGTEGHTWLQRDSSSHLPLPDEVTSMYPVCPPSKERVCHKWASPSFARGGRTHRQPELCAAKTQWALQASDHSQDQFRYDAGVATGFACGKERKLDSCMLCIFGVLRMMRIKWSKIKRHIRLSLTELFHLSGRVSHCSWNVLNSWGLLAEAGICSHKWHCFSVQGWAIRKVSVQPVATDTTSRRQRQWIFCLSPLCSVQPLCE